MSRRVKRHGARWSGARTRSLFAAVFVGLSLLSVSPRDGSCEPESPTRARIPVFVTILPQVTFVERVGGDRVEVSAMVEPGRSPETYEPGPQNLARLSRAVIYFRAGIGFEQIWLIKVQSIHSGLRIVDTREGVRLLAFDHGHSGEEGNLDPHHWLDPRRVRIQARNIGRALEEVDPPGAPVYQANLGRFEDDLDQLDVEIRDLFRQARGNRFIVWHPAWGYLADAYGLQQFAVEEAGKEPNARRLAQILASTRERGFQVLFVPEQTRTRAMENFAEAAGLRIVRLDPLARDYLENMRHMARQIAEGLR